MTITGTAYNYYHFCHRQLWLFANNIQLENQYTQHQRVAEGKQLHKTAYPQRSSTFKELALDGIKIDFYDRKTQTVHEIKLTDKFQEVHEQQVKYYLYRLKEEGIANDPKGILEYPKLKKTHPITLTPTDTQNIRKTLQQIENIINGKCPPVIDKPFCKNCAYYDFCYVEE